MGDGPEEKITGEGEKRKVITRAQTWLYKQLHKLDLKIWWAESSTTNPKSVTRIIYDGCLQRPGRVMAKINKTERRVNKQKETAEGVRKEKKRWGRKRGERKTKKVIIREKKELNFIPHEKHWRKNEKKGVIYQSGKLTLSEG